jgi:hypothetical protein
MKDWVCQFCANIVRGRAHPPAYCARCGLGRFHLLGAYTAWPSGQNTPRGSALLDDLQIRRFAVIPPATTKPARERRRAKRIQPKEDLKVRLCQIAPLEAVNISAIGLLIEHQTSFKPGSVCEVELWRSGQAVRLRGEVVRSFVTNGGESGGIRYRTALQFLETPPGIYALLPELPQESPKDSIPTPAPE